MNLQIAYRLSKPQENMCSYSATFQACRVFTPNEFLSLSIPTMCCSGSRCDHHLWIFNTWFSAWFSGELEYANHDSRSKLCNSKLVYWYVYDPRTVWCSRPWFAFYTSKKWGHWYFLPRQALTRRPDFGTLKSWEVAVILDSIGSRVVAIHPTQCIMTHPFHETSLHSFIHSFILVYRVFKTSLEDLFFPSFVATHLKYTTLSKIKLN